MAFDHSQSALIVLLISFCFDPFPRAYLDLPSFANEQFETTCP